MCPPTSNPPPPTPHGTTTFTSAPSLSTLACTRRPSTIELEEELSRAKSALAAEQSRGESEVVLQLKKDLRSAQKKAQLSNEALEVAVAERDTAIREAKRRVEQTEAQLAAHARQEEDRDSVEARSRILQETRLSEMSALVGRYEASRLEDSRTIKHLRDEVFDLTEELRHARSRTPSVSDAGSSQGGESNAALLDKVAKLKSLLYLSNQRVVEQSSSTNAVRQGDPGSRGPSVIDVPPPSTHAVVAADDLSPDLLRAHEEITELVSGPRHPLRWAPPFAGQHPPLGNTLR